jgi:hypothetical protein
VIGNVGLLSSAEIVGRSANPDTVEELLDPEDRDIHADERFYCVERVRRWNRTSEPGH